MPILQVHVLGYNRTREWCEVQLVRRLHRCNTHTHAVGCSPPSPLGSSSSSLASSSACGTPGAAGVPHAIGWVPSLYIAPVNSLDKHRFIFGIWVKIF